MKIVRVLVYEGSESELVKHLRRRAVKGASPGHWEAVNIRERFVNHTYIGRLLNEHVDADDVRAALVAAKEE